MTISVIIPAYNTLDMVLRCATTLQLSAGERVEMLVQDDASPLVDMTCIPVANVQRNPQNVGFAANCNLGAARASGDILVFCNQDVRAERGWSDGWAAVIRAAFEDGVGIVAPRLLFENHAVQSVGGLLDARGTPFHRCLGWQNPQHPETNTPRNVTWATGAFLAIRRELFVQLNGFDTLYSPSYFEDVDLCLRARELGYCTRFEPRVSFIHSVASTGGSPHFRRSAMRFKERWIDTRRVQPDVNHISPVQFW